MRVLQVLLITSEDPHHAVLEAPLLSSFHMPLAESVDICSMVDIFVHEILFGFDFVSGLEVDLLRVHARIETGAGVLAVQHKHLREGLLLGAVVPPDQAECMLELEIDLAVEDDKQLGVALLSKDLILDEV